MRTHFILLVSFVLCNGFAGFLSGQTDPDHAQKMAAGLEIFKSDVRTVFSGRCIKCHNQDTTEGGLDLTTRETLLEGGDSGAVIEIGKPDESYLVQLIKHDEEPAMPAEGARLDNRHIDLIARWIELGAPYHKSLAVSSDADPDAWIKREIDPSAQEFWSFKPLQKVAVPRIENDSWSQNDVDRFVQRRLAEAKIVPNPMADRRALIRRAYFDLIGLPPSPEEVAAFINDNDDKAFEKLIDRLLESPHHGERWGRHWLDVVRFAESFGFEQDYDRPHAYQYRDFVIKALSSDMPFDQFVQWQLAGDEIAPDQPLALMATGFMGAGVFPTQLTEKEFESARYDELDDMVSTTGTGFLGLTIGCARCHDHKFDPIPMRDYYQMVSIFGNTIRSNVEIEINPDLTRTKLAAWQAVQQQIASQLSDYETEELPKKFRQWVDSLAESVTTDQPPEADDAINSDTSFDSKWIAIHCVSAEAAHGTILTVGDDAKIRASGANPKSESYTMALETGLTGIRSLRLEVFPDASLKKKGPGRAGNGNFALGKLTVTAEPLDDETQSDDAPDTELVKLVRPRATFEQNDSHLSIQATLDDDPNTGWAIDPKFGQRHTAVFDFAQPVGFPGGTRLIVKMDFSVNTQHSIGVSRLSISQSGEPLSLDEEPAKAFDAELNNFKNTTQKVASKTIQRILNHEFKHRDETWRQLVQRMRDHEAQKPKRETVKAMICSEGVKPIPHHGDDRGFPHFYPQTYFLNRGDANQKIAAADPGFLQALTPLSFVRTAAANSDSTEPVPDVADQDATGQRRAWDLSRWQPTRPSDATTSYRRRTLANWITDTRAGAGHLLARVIVNRLWQHHFGRGLVATPNDFGFQGARCSHSELLDYLAQRLIENGWRLKPLHRLMMSSATYRQSSTYDAQKSAVDPENQWLWRYAPRRLEAEIIRDSMLQVTGQLDTTPFGPGSLDESMRRRSIYFTIKRSKLIPFLQIYDAPEPLVSVGDRPATTVAPQALICMNNQQVRQWATAFSTALQTGASSASKQIDLAYQRALSRSPNKDELRESTAFFESQLRSYLADEKKYSSAQSHTLALADVCQVLMSLNEFVYID